MTHKGGSGVHTKPFLMVGLVSATVFFFLSFFLLLLHTKVVVIAAHFSAVVVGRDVSLCEGPLFDCPFKLRK